MKILIAEDDVTSRLLLISLLEKNGHLVVVTTNGAEAWAIMQKPEAPRLAVLDWLMPEMDGKELCGRIKSMAGECPPYIIMLTVKGEKADIILGLEAGADDYLSKPYDPDELKARIAVGQRILGLQDSLAARLVTVRENETRIKTLLREKELLLQEVHHRMKNNMYTIGSLLEMQASSMREPDAAAALRDAQRRLLSMGVLYDKLYRSDNVRGMSIKDYLPDLVDEIIAHFADRSTIRIEKHIEDFVLGAKTLTTLGIIVNEAITNCMKHAFHGRDDGVLLVSAASQNGHAVIAITDNGPGLPDSPGASRSGFGLQLIAMLAEQMAGTIKIEGQREPGVMGTKAVLEFPINP